LGKKRARSKKVAETNTDNQKRGGSTEGDQRGYKEWKGQGGGEDRNAQDTTGGAEEGEKKVPENVEPSRENII